jgi:hypothetical protein
MDIRFKFHQSKRKVLKIELEMENLAWKGFSWVEGRITKIWLVPLCKGEMRRAMRKFSGFARDGIKSRIELSSSSQSSRMRRTWGEFCIGEVVGVR